MSDFTAGATRGVRALYAGESVAGISDIRHAAELVRE